MSEVALEPGPSSADRLRRVHLGMIDAVLGGGGHGRVAELAAAELGGSVAIVLPGLEVAVVRPPAAARHLGAVRRYVTDRLLGRPAEVPAALNAEAPSARATSGSARCCCSTAPRRPSPPTCSRSRRSPC